MRVVEELICAEGVEEIICAVGLTTSMGVGLSTTPPVEALGGAATASSARTTLCSRGVEDLIRTVVGLKTSVEDILSTTPVVAAGLIISVASASCSCIEPGHSGNG